MDDLELFIKSGFPTLLKASLESLSDLGSATVGKVKKVLNNDVTNYLESELRRVLYVKTILHRSAPVYLYNVYEPLLLLSKSDRKNYNSVDLAWQLRSEKGCKFTFLGEAGSGKTTLIRDLFFQTVSVSDRIPVIVELRNWNRKALTFEEFVNAIATRVTPSNREITVSLLKKGRLVLFLDGLDEVPSGQHTELLQGIGHFHRRYPDNSLIMTSRPFSGVEMLQEFTNFSVCRIDEKQLVSFVAKQVAEGTLAEKISRSLLAKHPRAYVEEFSGNPLLVSLFILTYQTFASMPERRHVFFGRVVDALFSEHDSLTKVGFERERKSGLEKDVVESLLMRFSLITFFNDEVAFEAQKICYYFDQIKQRMNLQFDNYALIDDLKVAIGIWTEDSGRIAFAHRSIHEYFAALYFQRAGSNSRTDLYKKLRDFVATRFYSHSMNLLVMLKELNPYDYLQLFATPFLKEAIDFLQIGNEEELLKRCSQLVQSMNCKWDTENGYAKLRSFQLGDRFFFLNAVNEIVPDGRCDPTLLAAMVFGSINLKERQFDGEEDAAVKLHWDDLLRVGNGEGKNLILKLDEWFKLARSSVEKGYQGVQEELERERVEQRSILDLI